MFCRIGFLLLVVASTASGQVNVHLNAHSHNDYEHTRPLFEALENGFNSVEADVHFFNDRLLVGHDGVNEKSPSLEKLYLAPLDSLLKKNGGDIYKSMPKTFYLMIDVKTEAAKSYQALKTSLSKYPALHCKEGRCPVKIFLSGNSPTQIVLKEGYMGFALDGRPEDVGKRIPVDLMPVISDTYVNWSNWQAKSPATPEDMSRIRELASRVHAEGKLFRLWATPDNELAWKALLDAGVDLINTDRLDELNKFLSEQKK